MLATGQPPDKILYGLCAVAGVAFHLLYARWVEIDFMVWRLLGTASVLGGTLVWLSHVLWHMPLATALLKLSIGAAVFSSTLSASVLIYRGFFHSLRRFPGPFAARYTSFWAVWKSGVNCRFHEHLTELHRKHGDFVRIGPRLLSINRPDALPQIMALRKGVFWGHTGNDHTKLSFSLSRVSDDHKNRRRPWEQAFSTPVMDKFDRGIQEVISIFVQNVRNRQGDPVDVPKEVGRLTFDIMGLVGYGHTFEGTAREITHPGLVSMRKAHYMLGRLRWTPWLMDFLAALPGGSDFVPFLELCSGVVSERQAEHQANKSNTEETPGRGERKDVMAHLLEAMDQGGQDAPPTQAALGGESRVMIAAGADTTQTAVANALWFMAANPSATRRLQALLDGLFPEGPDTFSYAKLIADKDVVGWTDAVMNETIRLRSANMTGLPRTTDPEGMLIASSEYGPEVWIPGGVEVLAPTWAIHRDERSFARPDEFVPDRWLPDSGILCNQAAHFPFSIGKHVCVGKPLAVREMRSIIARVAMNFDLEFAPGQNWQQYEQNILDLFTMTLPPFHVVFKERIA